ncbi:response regulator [Oceanisphaera sp. W20_SRM_FM3]|uniref:response regulator n=1 Tax=Oceanisphaera sp. W20_SRM_FM3 TaxID=3240267 RepID=UPI003F95D31A
MNNKVLIVEDELIFGQNLQLYLEAQQFDIRIARDGACAINLVQEHFTPDIIVLDFRLPDMCGLQVLDQIGSCWQGQCVLMTGNPSSEVSELAAQHGIKHLLFKPFPLAELMRSIRTLINSSQQGQAAQSDLAPERRRHQNEHFPLQMYDGTWIQVDRRQSQQDERLDVSRQQQELFKNNCRTKM